MTINPIIPLWFMLIICFVLSLLILKTKNRYSFIRKIIIIILLFTINLRVMIPLNAQVDLTTNNLNVLFVIDTTISMLAEDYQGNTPRINAVKEDCRHIIDTFKGSSFSIITFDNHAQRVIPLTKDSKYTLQIIDNLKVISEIYSRGSSLNVAIDETVFALEASNQIPDSVNIIFFISDGEITNQDTLKSFSKSKDFIGNGAVLGYGSHQGGYMAVANIVTKETEYLQDKTHYPYTKALSKIDENNLKKIASDMGVDYVKMDKTTNIDHKLDEIKQNVLDTTTNSKIKRVPEDIYYFFVIPLALLLLYEMITLKRRLAV